MLQRTCGATTVAAGGAEVAFTSFFTSFCTSEEYTQFGTSE